MNNDYKENYDPIIKDPKPFKAKDGTYHATMKEVDRINDAYFQGQRKCINNLIYAKGLFLEVQESLSQPQFAAEEDSEIKRI